MKTLMDLILNPLTNYAILATGLLLSLWLFLTLKRENAILRRQIEADRDAAEVSLASLRQSLTEIQRLNEPMDACVSTVTEPQVQATSMNVTRRSQALRMHRRGEAPAQIARALQMPRNEVDLLLKVHRTVVAQT